MKVEVNQTDNGIKYPLLMVNKKGIESQIGLVLAISEKEVFHLVGNYKYVYSDNFKFLLDEFEPFTGTITLSNL